MLTDQANFLQSLGWAVLNSLWQMALLWVLYQVITALYKSSKSSFRSSLASIMLITGFGFFIYTFLSFFKSQAFNETLIISSMLNSGGNPEWSNWLQIFLPYASIVYLVLLLIPVSHFIRNYRYVQVIRRHGLTRMDVQWRVFINKVGNQLGIKKTVQLWVSEFVSSPVTIGFLKPVILIPLAAINNLSSQQMEAVLLHELSHIKRNDYLVNLVINFIKTILYFNPFVKAFVKIVEKEREKSCDEMVLQFQYDSYEYATALLTLEKANHDSKQLVIGATGKKKDILQRVELIMGVKTKPALSFNKFAGILAGLICIIALNALLLFSKPTDGKTEDVFATISSPFNFLTYNISELEKSLVPKEQKSEIKTTSSSVVSVKPQDKLIENVPPPPPAVPEVIHVSHAYRQAGYSPPQTVELKKYEEAQVKAAMDASKKVMANEEWKALETNIADVFTQKEKDELKVTYKKAMDKMDWDKWENKLRQSYDDVDWNRVNEQLSSAVNNIRMDSLQKVYTEAIVKLDLAKKELSQNNLPGIPDTDITLKTIEEKKLQLQKIMDRLKVVRTKKTVHL